MLELRASGGACVEVDATQNRVPVGRSTIGLIAATRKPHVTTAQRTGSSTSDVDDTPRNGFVAFTGYPLLIDSKLVAVMAISSRHDLSPAALESMAAVADAVAVRIERKRAEAELARHTRHLEAAHDRQRLTTSPRSATTSRARHFGSTRRSSLTL